ncbi:transketolase family protein [Agathobaculum sp.]|uniref:transketolase family protein n=1 Tax=Agathobaculum sp. TaxID=2048138 RepID=UPI002A7F83E3|nr:transketolase C-terminal domain-containing protein [Agathobaculum sp.]MDY3617602.1 transketolase C-terminal domain-containing protein [Agathobaculum sp.]
MKYEPMRDGYGRAVLALSQSHDDVLVLDADVAKSTRTEWVHRQNPAAFLDMGISEQDMVGTACGMALTGLTPFLSTYGVFLAGRAWDQIRNTVCYNHLNVKLAGAHAGISVGPDGATHQALEDLALMRVLPGMTVLTPCDSNQTYQATLAMYEHPGPCFIRFGREAVPVVTEADEPFVIGKNRRVREGDGVTLFACGAMVYHAMQAAELLEPQGVSARVVDVGTVKPLDVEDVVRCAQETGAAVTCEEHQITGGLGSAVCEALAAACPIPVERVGIKDSFGESGAPDELMQRYGLDADAIVQAALRAVSHKH